MLVFINVTNYHIKKTFGVSSDLCKEILFYMYIITTYTEVTLFLYKSS